MLKTEKSLYNVTATNYHSYGFKTQFVAAIEGSMTFFINQILSADNKLTWSKLQIIEQGEIKYAIAYIYALNLEIETYTKYVLALEMCEDHRKKSKEKTLRNHNKDYEEEWRTLQAKC